METRVRESKLEMFISKSKYLLIGIVAFAVILGVGYALFQNSQKNKNLKIRAALEKSDVLYDEVFTVGSINEIDIQNNEDIKEKIDTLISELKEVLDIYGSQTNVFPIQETHYKLGQLYLLLEKKNEASDHFVQSIQLVSQSYLVPKGLMYLASLEEEKGNIDIAQSYLLRITDNYPNNIEFPRAQFNLGRIAEMYFDSESDTSTAQGYYLELVNNEFWSNSSWVNIAKSRLALLGYNNLDDSSQTDQAE